MANILLIVGLFVVALSSYAECAFTDNCMKCICEVEGCQSQVGKCRMDVGSYSCGPYQIKQPYYTDCNHNNPNGWQTCTKEMGCSETCVKSYMSRYTPSCRSRIGREPTCADYAKMHNMGTGAACSRPPNTHTNKVMACCIRKGGCN